MIISSSLIKYAVHTCAHTHRERERPAKCSNEFSSLFHASFTLQKYLGEIIDVESFAE